MLFHPDTRKGFLEHMRNMTWQVLVLTLSVAMFLTVPKEQSCWYQVLYVLAAMFGVALWIYSVLASGMTFIETSLKSVTSAEKELSALRGTDLKKLDRIKANFILLRAHWGSIWLECIIAIVAVAIGGIISLAMGVTYGVKVVSDILSM